MPSRAYVSQYDTPNGFGENYTRARDSGDGERSGHSFPLGDYFDCWTCPERLMRHGCPPLPNPRVRTMAEFDELRGGQREKLDVFQAQFALFVEVFQEMFNLLEELRSHVVHGGTSQARRCGTGRSPKVSTSRQG